MGGISNLVPIAVAVRVLSGWSDGLPLRFAVMFAPRGSLDWPIPSLGKSASNSMTFIHNVLSSSGRVTQHSRDALRL